MSPEIKRMLAERAWVEAQRAEAAAQAEVAGAISPDVKELLAMLDRAKPYIDEGCPPNRWPPSALLAITYFILATGPNPDGRSEGAKMLWRMLERARRRFLAGLHPNPLLDDGRAP